MAQSSRTTQCDRVLKYMQDFGSITPLEAISDLGVLRLSARIADLKDRGIKIETTMATSMNRYNQKTHYAKYSLKENE